MARKTRISFLIGLAIAVAATVLLLHAPASAIHDKDNLGTYKIPGTEPPDKELAGFFLNMGPTGARGILTDNSFIVKHIFKGSPAVGKLKLDDEVTGAFGKPFGKHTFGYLKHGYEGPIMDMGEAIEKADGSDGKLALNVKRGAETLTVTIDLQPMGTFSSTFPFNCKKSQTLRANALKYLAEDPNAQIGNGSAHALMTVTLALLTSEDPKQFALGKKMALGARISADELKKPVNDVGWSWYLSHPLITLSEYYMLTKDASVLPSIRYLSDGLANHSQWKAPIPSFPPLPETPDKAEKQKELDWIDGGLGHVSFTGWKARGGGGYGPMQMSSCIGVIAWQAAERCGVTTIPGTIARSIGYINRGTSGSGAMAYGGYFKGWEKDKEVGSYVGKTAASLIVHQLSPEFEDSPKYIALSIDYMSKSYKSMPDGHACNNITTFWTLMGSGASGDEKVLRSVMDYHKAYFNMMRCHDGSFALLPGRDFADGGWFTSSRYHPTATMVLALGLDHPKLLIQGLQVNLPGGNPKALKGKADIAYKAIVKKNYVEALTALKGSSADDSVAQAIFAHIDVHAQLATAKMEALEKAGDIASLNTELAKGQKMFGLLPSFKEKVLRFENAFREEPWKFELKLEANYRQLVGMLRRNKSMAYVGDLERFGEKYQDSLYGKWALAVAKEYRASSTIIEPRVDIAPMTPPPIAASATNQTASSNSASLANSGSSVPAKSSGSGSAEAAGVKDAKPAKAAKKDSTELRVEFQQRMVRKLETMLAGGAKIEVWVSNWGPKRERYKIHKVSDIGLVIQDGESLLPVPWDKLSTADRIDLVKGMAKEEDVEALLISAVMQHLAGRTGDAETALAIAMMKDAEAAKKVKDAIAGH